MTEIAEEEDAKTQLLRRIGDEAEDGTILSTTTSALSVTRLAEASGRPGRFVGLHVFNPVPRMELVEIAYTSRTMDVVRARTRELCETLGKTAVEVPDTRDEPVKAARSRRKKAAGPAAEAAAQVLGA